MGMVCSALGVPKIDVHPPHISKHDVENYKHNFQKSKDIKEYLDDASAEVLKENKKDEQLAEEQKRKVGDMLEKEVNDTLVKQHKPKYSDIVTKCIKVLNDTPVKDVVYKLVDEATSHEDFHKIPYNVLNKAKTKAKDTCMQQTAKQILEQIVTQQVEDLKNKKQ